MEKLSDVQIKVLEKHSDYDVLSNGNGKIEVVK
jgi:hypothetical protein